MTSIVDRLKSRDAFLIGTWAKIAALETVELIGHAGFDFAVVDMEHAPHTFATAYQAIAQAQAVGMAALVRTPDSSGSAVQRLLDAGADGLMIPRVQTPQEARDAIASSCFPPIGHRGMGFTSRASRWGLDSNADYLERGRNHILRCAQLEDVAALEEIDAILEAPGLNAVFIGFGDLTLSSGLPPSHPRLLELEAKVVAAARARNIPCGTAVQTPAEAAQRRDAGYAFVMVSADTSMFAKAVTRLATETRAALGHPPSEAR